MTCYSIKPRHQIFVKGYGFFSFAESMRKHIDKNISKNWSSKYSQNLFYNTNKPATDAIKTTLKRVIQKTEEGLKSQGLNYGIVQRQLQMKQRISELKRGIPKNTYISPEKRQQIIDGLKLI